MAVAFRTFFKGFRRVFISALHAAVAVVVDRAITDVVFVHQVNHIADCFRVVGCVTVDFDVEDVAASGQVVIWSLDFGLVSR